MHLWLTIAALLICNAVSYSRSNNEDFGFDASDEDLVLDIIEHDEKQVVHKLQATVGKLFRLVARNRHLSRTAIYESKQNGSNSLLSWLIFNKTDAEFSGVPLDKDAGILDVVVTGYDKELNLTEKFRINIKEKANESGEISKCNDLDTTILSFVIDRRIEVIKPKQRITAINNISKFFGIPDKLFTLKTLHAPDNLDSTVILAGPGNLDSKSSSYLSTLELPVGCDGRLWLPMTTLIHQIKQQARDGTISEVLRLPLVGWRVKTEHNELLRLKRQADETNGSGDYEDYYDDYEEYDDEDNDEKPTIIPTETTTPSVTHSTQSTSTLSTSILENNTPHPHRHHHGEVNVEEEYVPDIHSKGNNELDSSSVTEILLEVFSTTMKTTDTETLYKTDTTLSKTHNNTFTTKKSVEESTQNYDDYYDYEDGSDEDSVQSVTVIPKQSEKPEIDSRLLNVDITTPSTSTTTEIRSKGDEDDFETFPSTDIDDESTTAKHTVVENVTVPVFTTVESTYASANSGEVTEGTLLSSTIIPTLLGMTTTEAIPTIGTTDVITTTDEAEDLTAIPSTTANLPTTTNATLTTKEETTIVTVPSTTIREITESVEFDPKNFPPYIENRLKQKYVIAGKIFRFIIPRDTFKDFEDEYNLNVEFLDKNGNKIDSSSWCHFNSDKREVYGLPLEEDVSKWEYVIRATDKEGLSVQDRLTIQVQQHKLQRAVNHEFSLEIRIEKHDEFKHFVDWSLKILKALGHVYSTNTSEITVRRVNYTSQPAIFTWTNDTLPTSYCPKSEIESLFKLLTANDRGDASRELNLALAPEMRVKKVVYYGLGVCEEIPTPVVPTVNYPPILRNPVDHVNATVGELLIYKVPEDTFYDPEDVDYRTLNITLLTADRQELPFNSWLQFDSKNREFYGIPTTPSRNEYQLICTDTGGLLVSDSLEVVVYQTSRISYSVEFSMTIEVQYDTFVNSAALQKKFVDKLMELFGDKQPGYLHFNPFKQKQSATVISWYNKTLPTDKCPTETVTRLEMIMKNSDRGIAHRVHSIMEPEFSVSTIKVLPMNICKASKPKASIPKVEDKEKEKTPIDESSLSSSSDDYLITFIVPAVIISIMLLLAILAACILYRRRRSGKMNLDEDGRQSYGNKGIPVIFQEELEEKPETCTKAPVILKDEKPPLAPPEYSKSGSLKLTDDSEPYQPPPPFARGHENGKQLRPKPTPTYRKPPPYMPP